MPIDKCKKMTNKKIWDEFKKDLEVKLNKYINEHRVVQRILIKYFKKNTLILEAGCGSARDSALLSLKYSEIISLDYSIEALKVGKEIRKMLNASNILIMSDINHIPFLDDTFDTIFSIGVIHYINNKTETMNVFKNILKKQGILIISVPNIFSLHSIIKIILIKLNKWNWGNENNYHTKKLFKLMTNNSFRIIDSFQWSGMRSQKLGIISKIFPTNIGVVGIIR